MVDGVPGYEIVACGQRGQSREGSFSCLDGSHLKAQQSINQDGDSYWTTLFNY